MGRLEDSISALQPVNDNWQPADAEEELFESLRGVVESAAKVWSTTHSTGLRMDAAWLLSTNYRYLVSKGHTFSEEVRKTYELVDWSA